MDFFQSIIEFFSSPVFKLIVNLFYLFAFVLYLSLAKWTYSDAQRRGAMAFYWTIVGLLFPIAGWLIYLIVRPPEFIDDIRERELEIKAKEVLLNNGGMVCPTCHKSVEKDFLICPYCRRTLKKSCPSCSRPLQTGWEVCPYCQQIL
ncbi:MAG: zinc ribbon domain-containing protein [Actinobacteria bacterium]|nr:zinc ribbon domain-containing protein [Actinomycetota bacterium]